MLSPMYSYDGENITEPISDSPELIHKTAEVLHVYSGNIVNTTGKTAPGSTLGESIHFNFENDVYYVNPFTNDRGHTITIKPKDKDGNAIYFTKLNGDRNYYIELHYSYMYEITVDDLTLEYWGFQNMATFLSRDFIQHNKIILDSKPAYWTFDASGYTEGDEINIGFTQKNYNEQYVSYIEPVKSYVYSKKLDNHIEGFTDNLKNELLIPSNNLLDYSKINWNPRNGYYLLAEDYYMPVTEGETILTDITQGFFYFYNSSYTQISYTGFSVPYLPVAVPEGAVWARVVYSTGWIEQGDPVMVWKARTALSAKYERPIYRPSVQFDPKYANNDIFNYASPTSLTQGVMRMARFAALRAANERQSAYRFGTFNVFVNTVGTGVPNIREMALDYALDFIGFQECAGTSGEQMQQAMYQFQFPYYAGATVNGVNVGVPAVSRFEVTDVEVITLADSKPTCLKITMNMPQNKHYPRKPTLTVYNYHGNLGLAKRLSEIQTMLNVIAEDTSDFIVIMGDTNSEVDQQGHRQSWDAWEAAGFTAVHHGESPTWPNPAGSRYSSMDNIFVSEHINVLGYDIIMSDQYPINDSGQGGRPLSDHDLVFADLQFDFDAVLKDTWEEPPTVT